jgi:hypothetical protein
MGILYGAGISSGFVASKAKHHTLITRTKPFGGSFSIAIIGNSRRG